MDVMALRRSMMEQIGGSAMIGEFSVYQKVTAIPHYTSAAAAAELKFSHTLGVTPKLIIISCANDSGAATTQGYITYGVFSDVCGSVFYTNLSSGVDSVYGYPYAKTNQDGRFWVDDSEGRIGRVNNFGLWETNTTYTIELYA